MKSLTVLTFLLSAAVSAASNQFHGDLALSSCAQAVTPESSPALEIPIQSDTRSPINIWELPTDYIQSSFALSTNEILRPNVVKLFVDSNHKYVVRFDKSWNSEKLAREVFNSRFARSVPGLTAPYVKTLTEESATSIYEQVYHRDPEYKMSANIQTVVEKALTGQSYLAKSEFGFYTEILSLDLSSVKGLRSFLKLQDVAGASRALGDFQRIYPMLPRPKLNWFFSYLRFFRSIPEKEMQLKREYFAVKAIETLPTEIRQKIADYWIIYRILGIIDFHGGNYLVRGNQVIGIDLANSNTRYYPDDPLNMLLLKAQNPYFTQDDLGQSSPVLDLTFSDTSPKLREYLRSLSSSTIVSLAQETNYQIPESEITKILKRRDAFLRVLKE